MLDTVEDAEDAEGAVVLVEGTSDRAALETLARRRGLDLAADGIRIVPIGGATSIARYVSELAPLGSGVRLGGLCDAGEERAFRRALERAGFGDHLTRDDMESIGFYVCVADLEDELIRALGVAAVEAIVEDEGDLRSWRTFQNQPAQRGRAVEQQLRRFMGTRSGRKIHYAHVLVDAVPLERVPRPLDGVLAHVASE
jgi:Overcoming lysogenization defect protein-like, TOPRIM domain